MALGDRVASRWCLLLLEVTTSELAWWWSLLKHTKKIVWCSGEVIVRSVVLAPREPQRATLVDRVIELPLLLGFLRCLTCGLGG